MAEQRTRTAGRVRAVIVVVVMLIGVVLLGVGDDDAPGIAGHLDSLGTGLLIGCGSALVVLLWGRREQP